MDLLASIREKINVFSDTNNYLGLQSVVAHIEVAERHLEMGKKGDDYYFTDVIYRTNQAFEGLLKEAYILLSEKNAEHKSPHQIEKYLEQESLLKERVLSLFSNYRTEWRNKSTHDYKLYFSAQEAFLAIVSICAFFNILLDQMIEAKAYIQEQKELEQLQILVPGSHSDKPLIDQTIELLTQFSKDEISTPTLFEYETLGTLSAYLDAVAPDIEVFREYKFVIGGTRTLVADFLLKKGDESLIIEVKNSFHASPVRRKQGFDQLISYMNVSGAETGILYIPSASKNQEVVVEKVDLASFGLRGTIVEIYSKTSKS